MIELLTDDPLAGLFSSIVVLPLIRWMRRPLLFEHLRNPIAWMIPVKAHLLADVRHVVDLAQGRSRFH